ncbi:MbnP family protein [Hymenobacter daeguensis]
MKRFAIPSFAAMLSLAALTLAGCKKDEPVANTGTVTLHMDNGVTMTGTSGPAFNSLALATGSYVNAAGDDFKVTTFKYYISNVKLLKADNSVYTLPKAYYLVDHSKPETQELEMSDIPVGDYTAISFMVGVDSVRSKAGNFTEAALNSNNGMLWTMNGVDEFINLNLTGYSTRSPSGGITFHIAGYKHSTTNTIRTVTVPFPAANSPMLVRPDHSPEIHMQVDIAKMFTGPNPIRFSGVYNVMGGAPAVQIADNIQAGMFTVAHVHAN